MDFLVCLLISVLFASAQGRPEELPITCEAPATRKGDNIEVVCNFNTAVTDIQSAHLAVDHYGKGSNNPDEVVSCTNLHSSAFQCESKRPGYTFKTTTDSDKMVLEIVNVKEEDEGLFVCKLMAPDIDRTRPTPCQLVVIESTIPDSHSTATSDVSDTKKLVVDNSDSSDVGKKATPAASEEGVGQSVIIASSAGGVLLLAVILFPVCFVLIRRRRNGAACKDTEKGEKTGADSTGSSSSSLNQSDTIIDTQEEESDPLLNVEGKANHHMEENESEQKSFAKDGEYLSNTSEAGDLAMPKHPAETSEAASDKREVTDSASFAHAEGRQTDGDITHVTPSEVPSTTCYTSTAGYAHSDPQPPATSNPNGSYEDEGEDENDAEKEDTDKMTPTERKDQVLERLKKRGIAVPTVAFANIP